MHDFMWQAVVDQGVEVQSCFLSHHIMDPSDFGSNLGLACSVLNFEAVRARFCRNLCAKVRVTS